MLDYRLRLFLILICVAALIYLVVKMRSKRVDVKYTLPWLLLDFLMLIMAVFPDTVDWACRVVGIKTPSNIVFAALLLLLLVIVYVMSRTISRLNNEIRELAQRVALDEVKEK